MRMVHAWHTITLEILTGCDAAMSRYFHELLVVV
jgi:hypothetical protein